MPYPNEHACRLRDPGDFQADSFRRSTRKHEGKSYSVIMGKLKGETTMSEQAYRYPKKTWTTEQARKHCKSHDGGTFEAAAGKDEAECAECYTEDYIEMDDEKQLVTPFAVKAFDEEERTFTGLASTWELDLGGDVIQKGAFKDTLKDWRASGAPLPLLDSHNGWGSIRNVIGKALDAKETDEGLEMVFKIIDGPDGDEIYRRIRGGLVNGLSIGYEPKEIEKPSDREQLQGIWRKLKKVNLREVSIVVWPMNLGARIRDVKTLEKVVTETLDGIDPASLNDEEKQSVRRIAGHCGPYLRLSEPGQAPTARGKEAGIDPPCPAAPQPEVPPTAVATAPKAEEEPMYFYDDALRLKIEGVRRRQTRLNIQSPKEQGDTGNGCSAEQSQSQGDEEGA